MPSIDLTDPYPAFSVLRAQGPVYVDPDLGLLLALSHASCLEVLQSPDFVRADVAEEPREHFPALNLLSRTSLLQLDGRVHERMHALLDDAIAHGHVERITPPVRAFAAGHVEVLAERIRQGGSADLVSELTVPTAFEGIAELLDLPEQLRPRLRNWMTTLGVIFEKDPSDVARRAAEHAAQALVDTVGDLVRHRSRQPGDDLISDLVHTGMSTDEIVGTTTLLLLAGHEPTAGAIGNGVSALLRHRVQWQRLIDDPGVLDTAVEELVRFDPPVQLVERVAVRDTTVADQMLPRTTKIAAVLGSAAHDPRVFTRPDELDVGRRHNPHLGFGAGPHRCPGASLARTVVRATLSVLLNRLPGLDLFGQARRRPGIILRSWETLPVTA